MKAKFDGEDKEVRKGIWTLRFDDRSHDGGQHLYRDH